MFADLHHLFPLIGILFDQRGELLAGQRHHDQLLIGEQFDRRRVFHHREDFLGQAVDDRLRHAGRQDDADPRRHVETGDRLADRRDVGQVRHALRFHDRERHDLLLLHVRPQRRHVVERHLHLAGDQPERRGTGALVGNVHELDAGRLREQFRLEMTEIADAGGGVIERAGLLLGELDQLGHVVHGQRRMHGEQRGQPDHRRHVDEVLHRVIGQVLVDPLVDRHRRVGRHRHRVAVGRRLLQCLKSDLAVGAAAVLDDDGLLQTLRQIFGDDAGDHVGAAAGRVWNDHPDRSARRPFLGDR